MKGQNNKEYFSQNIEKSMHSLYGLAFHLTGNHTDAEDLVAESVSKAWSAIDKLEDRKRFQPWIFRILHNCFISEYRKKSVRPKEFTYEEQSRDEDGHDISSLLLQQSDDFLDWWGNPEKEFINNLLGKEIMSAIGRLPEAFRVTVFLVNVEGLTYDEAAVVLDVPSGTVRSRMKRGRTLLQKELWKQAKDAGLLSNKSIHEVN